MEKKHVEISKDILNHIGGKDNVASALHCYTRLRINIKDKSLVETEALKSLDILGAQFMGN